MSGENVATIGQLIKYLKENFRPEDELCYMDYIQGYKNDCTYVTKEQLGTRFFRTVKELKNNCKHNGTITDMEDIYPYVDDNDVIVY